MSRRSQSHGGRDDRRSVDEAAQRFAQLLSLLATCAMHDVNPETWLADVLLAVGERGLIAEDLLPWHWKRSRGREAKSYYDTA